LVVVVVKKTAGYVTCPAGNGKIQQWAQNIFKATEINYIISFRSRSGVYGDGKTHH
jgi:hypothetical protein